MASPVQAVKVTCTNGDRMPRIRKVAAIWSQYLTKYEMFSAKAKPAATTHA